MTTSFLAIDFETASNKPLRACAVGWAYVEDGKLKESGSELINPLLDEWEPFSMRIHGITPNDVRLSRTFDAVWDELFGRFRDMPVGAHSAAYDMGVVRSEFNRLERPSPEFPYFCTLQLSRRAWPELLSASLPDVAEFLDIELRHHEPASDAAAAALIAIKALAVLGETDPLSLSPVTRGERRPSMYRTRTQEFLATIRPGDDPSHPLFGKHIVFTGNLESMDRREAKAEVIRAGGLPESSVTKKTNFLVTGEPTSRHLRNGTSTKFRRAEELRAAGHDIQLLTEVEFLQLLALFED